MTVVGATTAVIATTAYVPPYKYVTSNAAAPQVTGSVTSALPINPTISSTSSDSDYAAAYLVAHRLSWPSYRYAYLLWVVFALLAGIYALSHHLKLSGGSLGAAFSKWGMRRRPVGRRKAGGARGRALPSNSLLVVIAIIVIVSCVLALLGADYIRPSSSILDFSSSFRKRYVAYTINKAFWTSGSRFGYMAFALIPLVILFALKAPPFAVFAIRPFTHLFADKLALFHRASAWLVWGFTTIHVVLWTIQLFQDQRNGRAVWFLLWTSPRLIFGVIAYAAMTAVMALSLKSIRQRGYEFFYISHVVFVILTLACSALHHPILWFWMAGAGGLWACERAWRFARVAKINGLFGKRKNAPLVAGKPYRDNSYGMQDIKRNNHSLYDPVYSDKTLPRPPAEPTSEALDFGRRSEYGYDEGSLQPLGSYESRYNDPQFQPLNDPHLRQQSIVSIPPAPAAALPPPLTPVPIPVGYAQAQLLPSRTIRLTINVARPFQWSPGQSVLLFLPDLSKFQSHPFTITNTDPTEIVLLVKARKGLTRRLFNLVRARSLAAVGITSQKDKRVSMGAMRAGETGVQVPPIFIRAWVDGPMGSAGRVRWQNHSSVMVVCGGSGVSFGVAVCEHVCRLINQRAGRIQRIRFCWVVREYAEIAWVAGQLRRCQEMVPANQLQIDIFVTNANKIRDEFAPPQPGFARGGHTRRGSSDSVTSEMSMDSPIDADDSIDGHLSANYADVIDLTNYEDEEDVNDPAEHHLSETLQQQGKVRRAKSRRETKTKSRMVKSPTYPPTRLQSTYQDEAEAQYVAAARGEHNPRSSYFSTQGGGERSSSNLAVDHSPSNSLYMPQSQPMLTSDSDRRQSYRSYADSTYALYDPFGGGGSGRSIAPSPSPSMFFDDTQSIGGDSAREILSRTSRTQSMVLLEDAGSDPTGDAGLWIDEADYAAMSIMSEMARAGKPKLSAIVEEEIEIAQGSMIVTTCGPVTLNTVVRNLVSKHISPARIRRGDKRGQIAIYSEDYEA
nr:uncharacterized protein CI109_002864 [Kwoniella shandongensis]KAA5528706.1 hypothetical protein CI109_002864 [Kwoniella shandongensis]